MLAASGGAFKRRESDRPSIGTVNSYARDLPTSNGNNPPPPLGNAPNNPTAIYNHITELSVKRIATITYLQHLHAQPQQPGHSQTYHFNTLAYTPQQLSTFPSLQPARLGRRAASYLLLGYSLPALLDLNSANPLEYLRALTALLSEFETYQTLTDTHHAAAASGSSSLSRAKMGAMFKNSMGLGSRVGSGARGRRTSATPDSIASLQQEPPEPQTSNPPPPPAASPKDPHPINLENQHFTHLLTPHLPFDPDFTTTFSTLCDALIETYTTLIHLVSNGHTHNNNSTTTTTTAEEPSHQLPGPCTPAVAEAFNKADKLVRKLLIAGILKEFEEHTRAGIKSEVSGVGKLVLGGLM
ncbi:hypothetical protein MBLNU230_g1551t1 [Neophaeotheca triangularis]